MWEVGSWEDFDVVVCVISPLFSICHLTQTDVYMYSALLGEADLLTGQVICPRTPPNALAAFAGIVPKPEEWIVEGVCAYVPQV